MHVFPYPSSSLLFLFFLPFFLSFFEVISHHVALAGLKPVAVLLPQPPIVGLQACATTPGISLTLRHLGLQEHGACRKPCRQQSGSVTLLAEAEVPAEAGILQWGKVAAHCGKGRGFTVYHHHVKMPLVPVAVCTSLPPAPGRLRLENQRVQGQPEQCSAILTQKKEKKKKKPSICDGSVGPKVLAPESPDVCYVSLQRRGLMTIMRRLHMYPRPPWGSSREPGSFTPCFSWSLRAPRHAHGAGSRGRGPQQAPMSPVGTGSQELGAQNTGAEMVFCGFLLFLSLF